MRCALLFLLLLAGLAARAGIAGYTDRGKIDFDTTMLLLNPYGTWSQIDGAWGYTPTDHQPPYTSGRWRYTEYGWYWQGSQPYSWATEHYGYWKRGADHVWSWFPTSYWLPQIVEIRVTDTHVGWRPAQVDSDGHFVEAPDERYAKTDEWSFVTRAQFAGPVTPGLIAPPALAAKLLDDSRESMHVYTTYRAIDRPGPHPADFAGLGENGMLAPVVSAETALVPSRTPALPPAPKPKSPPAAATNDVSAATDENGAPADPRQVRYWNTMSLPTYWTPRPVDGRPDQIYVYRPDFFQDQDGIERRIGLWLNPSSRQAQGKNLREVLGAPSKNPPAASSPSASNPFASPLGETFHGDANGAKKPAPKPKSPPPATTNGDGRQ